MKIPKRTKANTTPAILENVAFNLNPSGACNIYEQVTADMKTAGTKVIQ